MHPKNQSKKYILLYKTNIIIPTTICHSRECGNPSLNFSLKLSLLASCFLPLASRFSNLTSFPPIQHHFPFSRRFFKKTSTNDTLNPTNSILWKSTFIIISSKTINYNSIKLSNSQQKPTKNKIFIKIKWNVIRIKKPL